MKGRVFFFVFFCWCCIGCKTPRKRDSGAPAEALSAAQLDEPRYADGPEGLRSFVADMVNAVKQKDAARAAVLGQSLAVEDYTTWFSKHFDADTARRLSAEYAPRAGQLVTLPQALAAQHAKGRNELIVERFTEPDDPNATGLQATALKAMTTSVPLYSVRLVPPGKPSGFHLFNFIHDGQSFRFIGKLEAALDGSAPAADEARGAELRNKEREALLETGKLTED